jgi:hypothetical protein
MNNKPAIPPSPIMLPESSTAFQPPKILKYPFPIITQQWIMIPNTKKEEFTKNEKYLTHT